METVGTDRAHHGLNAGDGQGPRVEPDLGLAVWRRHISPGLIPHTQSSRIWRQASQVGQVPLMRHITERLGTGNISVSRTWDSLPFVMARRMSMIQTRTLPALRSTADHKDQPEGQQQADVPADAFRREPDGSPTMAVDSTVLDAHATASPVGIQREARPVSSEPLPLVQRSAAETRDRHQAGGGDGAGFSGPSQGPELSTVSPISLQRAVQPATSEPLPLVQRSAAGTHESQRDAASDAGGSLSEPPVSRTPSSFFSPASGLSMDAVPSSPVLRRVNRSSDTSVSTGDATMGEATRRTGSGKSSEVLVTEGTTHSISSPAGQGLTLFRHPKVTEAGATSSLVLQAPIVRRVLGRDVPTVSEQSGTDARPEGRVSEQASGHGHSNSDLTFVQPLPLVQSRLGSAVANGDPGVVQGPYQTSILRMRQAGPIDTQPMSASSGRRESSAAVPIILRNVRPTIHRTSGVEQAHEPAWNSTQLQNDSHVPAKGVLPSSVPLLPLVQATGRPLSGSDQPTLIWRSPISGVPTGVPSFDGFTDYQPDSGSISRNPMPFIARQLAHPVGSHVSRPGVPSMDELPALAGSREVSTSVNHADVAEQVSRLLTRQLAVERERRGVCS